MYRPFLVKVQQPVTVFFYMSTAVLLRGSTAIPLYYRGIFLNRGSPSLVNIDREFLRVALPVQIFVLNL